jgi:uncharacterized protein (DUF4415 family)
MSFGTAVHVFNDPFHASKPDVHPDGQRWHTMGLVGGVLLLVVHTWPEAASARDEPVGGSSAPERPPRAKGKPMKKASSKQLTRAELAELKSLAARQDKAIDTSDVPEILDWSGAKRGLFYRPIKQQLTLRLDADVIAWFKHHGAHGKGYQTRINRALREYVSGHAKKTRRARRA